MNQPLAPARTRRLIRLILREGVYRFSRHSEQQMQSRGLTHVDCVNVLRGGVVAEPELESGTWRYAVRTGQATVICAFRSESELVVITAWRNDR